MTNILLPPEFNTLAADVFNVKLTRANLLTKTDFDTKVSSVDSKIAANNSKNESIENKLKKGILDTAFLTIGTIYFDAEDGFQAYLIYQLVYRYFKIIIYNKYIAYC